MAASDGSISDPLPVAKTSTRKPFSTADEVTTISVVFIVIQPTDQFGPVYDFQKLLSQQKPDTTELDEWENDSKIGEGGQLDGAAALGKYFEDKYGRVSPRSLTELSAGYDRKDPFVDDTENAEAVIPRGWTTEHGGFYIGAGPLRIRPLRPDEGSNLASPATKAENFPAISAEIPALNSTRKRKLIIEDSDEENGENIVEVTVKRKKGSAVTSSQPIEPPGSPEIPVTPPLKKRKSVSVASVLGERIEQAASPEYEEFAVDTQGSSEKDVVQAQDETAGFLLPEETPELVRTVIDDLKRLTAAWKGKKRDFFLPEHNPDANGLLLKLEWDCNELSRSLRAAIFSHVADFLPYSKKAVLKQIRKLRQEDVDMKFEKVLLKLQRAITKDPNGGMDIILHRPKPSIKKLLHEAVKLKMTVYDLHKGDFATAEEYFNHFLDENVLPLWESHDVEIENIREVAKQALSPLPRRPSQTVKAIKLTVPDDEIEV